MWMKKRIGVTKIKNLEEDDLEYSEEEEKIKEEEEEEKKDTPLKNQLRKIRRGCVKSWSLILNMSD